MQACVYADFEPPISRPVRRQMLEGFNFLHSRGLCHNDVKSDNMVIAQEGKNYQLKLMDYGAMTKMSDRMTITTEEAKKAYHRTFPEVKQAHPSLSWMAADWTYMVRQKF